MIIAIKNKAMPRKSSQLGAFSTNNLLNMKDKQYPAGTMDYNYQYGGGHNKWTFKKFI
jgi:hypothetical protein